ncbi:phosphotransferase [Demequina globuliformis]|uniref:phosphotransferase n=1 Tax=Demequina globuliformis TaxID=676202 RepID=UPI0007858549|nr:phosphotransferase [Demequina globuliformis]
MNHTWVEGSILARGATATVYRGAPGQVIKKLNPGVPAVLIEWEAAAASAAHEAGVPTPALIDHDAASLTFEWVPGVWLEDAIGEAPGDPAQWVGSVLAEAHMHIREAVAPTSLKEVHSLLSILIDHGPLEPEPKARAFAALAALPRGQQLCHGDLHPRNILWNAAAPVVPWRVIDWSDGARGPAAADIARTRVLLEGVHFYVAPERREDDRAFFDSVTEAYLAATHAHAPTALAESDSWLGVVRAARLTDSPPEGEERALRARLSEIGWM